jgi:hypothetical protein
MQTLISDLYLPRDFSVSMLITIYTRQLLKATSIYWKVAALLSHYSTIAPLPTNTGGKPLSASDLALDTH